MAGTSAGDLELPAALLHAGDGLGGLTSRVEELHGAIASRAFERVGPAAAPVRVAHDAIARAVYGSVRLSVRGAGAAAATAVRAAGGGPELTSGRRGSVAQAAVCGVIGDRLARERSPLTIEMAVRHRGADVPLVASVIAETFPDAGEYPVLLLHGLCEQEGAWSLGARAAGGTYATRVLEPLGATPIHLRYNSGLPLGENGRRLAELIERLLGAWPTPVTRLSIIGHSMGGIVGRSAIAHASTAGLAWTSHLHTIVTLGSPHAGAPAARFTDAATTALGSIPEGRPVATVLRTRSAGIHDLSHGCFAVASGAANDPPATATHHAVSATVRPSERSLLSRIFGDLLVLAPSAHGLRRRRHVPGFHADTLHHLGGAHHFTLLNTPRLDGALARWLEHGDPRALPPDS